MRRDEITIRHYDHEARPCVCVKVHAGPWDWETARAIAGAAADFATPTPYDPAFSAAWIGAHLDEEARESWYACALEHGWEQLREDTREIFGRAAQVYQTGRSGGWAYVDGFTADHVREWDAIAIAKWGRFARYCRETVADLPYLYADLIYHNVYLPACEAAATERARAAAAEVWRLSAVATLCGGL